MIYGKKKMQVVVRLTLVVFLICTMLSYAAPVQVNAGISPTKYNIIQMLTPLLKDGSNAADRSLILDYITVDAGAASLVMKEVKDISLSDVASVLNKHKENLTDPDVDTKTLGDALNDFYQFQHNRPSEASYILSRFKTGLAILDAGSTGGFQTIEQKIKTYTFDYLMFINFVQEVKVNFNTIKENSARPLYEGSDHKIYINAKLQELMNMAGLFQGIIKIDAYKAKLVDLIGKTNESTYNGQRPAFIANLSDHGLLDIYIPPVPPVLPDHERDSTPSGSGSSGGTTTTPTSTPGAPTTNSDGSASVSVTAGLNSSGNAAASVSESTMSQLLSLSQPQADGTKAVTIEVPKVDGAKGYTVSLPGSELTKATDSENITIKTDAGNITIPSNTFANDNTLQNKSVSVNIAKVDNSTLSAELQQKIGDKPVISLSFTVDGASKEYNNPNAPVTVSFKYTPTAAEAANPEFIVVRYIDNAGNLIEVPSGRYDAATGMVTFTTTHFSKYTLVYSHKILTDVPSSHWAKKAIEVLASKGIVKGDTFAPESSITRGDYIAMLVRALGVNAVTTDNFSDVKTTDANYKEIAIAKKLGITNGIGNNMFKPDQYITRQDLMVLTDRGLAALKKIKARGTAADLDKYPDKTKVSAYAVGSVATMINEGICVGMDNLISPLSNTTRAQAAAIVYRIYNK